MGRGGLVSPASEGHSSLLSDGQKDGPASQLRSLRPPRRFLLSLPGRSLGDSIVRTGGFVHRRSYVYPYCIRRGSKVLGEEAEGGGGHLIGYGGIWGFVVEAEVRWDEGGLYGGGAWKGDWAGRAGAGQGTGTLIWPLEAPHQPCGQLSISRPALFQPFLPPISLPPI